MSIFRRILLFLQSFFGFYRARTAAPMVPLVEVMSEAESRPLMNVDVAPPTSSFQLASVDASPAAPSLGFFSSLFSSQPSLDEQIRTIDANLATLEQQRVADAATLESIEQEVVSLGNTITGLRRTPACANIARLSDAPLHFQTVFAKFVNVRQRENMMKARYRSLLATISNWQSRRNVAESARGMHQTRELVQQMSMALSDDQFAEIVDETSEAIDSEHVSAQMSQSTAANVGHDVGDDADDIDSLLNNLGVGAMQQSQARQSVNVYHPAAAASSSLPYLLAGAPPAPTHGTAVAQSVALANQGQVDMWSGF